MPVVLMVLSLLTITVGIVAIAWGIFNQTFDNNALIVGGTISAATGLGLFGCAALLEQLRRISESVEEGAGGLRHPPEFVNVTPMTTRRTAVGPPAVPTRARKPDWTEGATPRHEPSSIAEQPRMPAPLATEQLPLSSPPHDQMATTVASFVRRAITPSRSEQPRPAKQPGTVSSSDASMSGTAKRESARDRPQPPIRPLDIKADEWHGGGEREPAILKSGVIEGRPYTLYADGSIVVDLPQGQMKFASAEALRLHIEKKN